MEVIKSFKNRFNFLKSKAIRDQQAEMQQLEFKKDLSSEFLGNSIKLFTITILFEFIRFVNDAPNLFFIASSIYIVDILFSFAKKSAFTHNAFWLFKCFLLFGALDDIISKHTESVSMCAAISCSFAFVLFLNFLALGKEVKFAILFLFELFLFFKFYNLSTFDEL